MKQDDPSEDECGRAPSMSWSWAALAALLAASAAARAWLLWSTPLVPGMNGGYYLVQARALLERGALGIPDLPLTFLWQAAAAKLIHVATGSGLESCILLSVRLCDALLPPLVAVPVFLLGRAWCDRAGRSPWLAGVAALGVALGAPALSMVGDFQKNSLGLVWLAGLVFALRAWMARRTPGRAAAVLTLLALCGLTHIGVCGAALLLAALTGLADVALLRGREGLRGLRHALAVAAGGAAVLAAVAALVLWRFDPARVRRLASALSAPVTFVQTGGRPAGLDAHAGPLPGGGTFDRLRPQDRSQRHGGADRGGFPGPRGLPQGLASALFATAAAGALALPWRRRRELPAADRAAAFGCAATLLLLTGPWMRGDVVMRLQLIAVIPAAVCVAYVLPFLPGRRAAPAVACSVVALVGLTSVPLLSHGGRPIIRLEAADELRTLSSLVPHPERTLVVARHGLEWWTAWTLHTHVAQPRALRASDWSTYGAVLFLEEKGGRGHGAGGPPGFGGRAFGLRLPGRRPEGGLFNGPPPGFDGLGGPGGFGPPPGLQGTGGAPPMPGVSIPEDADVLHDGTHFRLARVLAPPAFLETPEDSAPPASAVK